MVSEKRPCFIFKFVIFNLQDNLPINVSSKKLVIAIKNDSNNEAETKENDIAEIIFTTGNMVMRKKMDTKKTH